MSDSDAIVICCIIGRANRARMDSERGRNKINEENKTKIIESSMKTDQRRKTAGRTGWMFAL